MKVAHLPVESRSKMGEPAYLTDCRFGLAGHG
jgi:hypothetical protein